MKTDYVAPYWKGTTTPKPPMNYTESFSFALPPLRLSLDKVITEKEKAGPMVVTSSPAKKTMFTTVPRPRSEKTNKTMVETTKRGYLKHRQMTVMKTLEQKLVKMFQRPLLEVGFSRFVSGSLLPTWNIPGIILTIKVGNTQKNRAPEFVAAVFQVSWM